jgi:5-methylcytosine-specific restriction endonuclease McrA
MNEAASCAYCGQTKPVHMDHVLAKSLVRNYNRSRKLFSWQNRPEIPAEWLAKVPACFQCNMLKSTRRLLPPTWAHRVDAISGFFLGARFQVWDGGRLPEVAR